MEFERKFFPSSRFFGRRKKMNLINNTTEKLWSEFIPLHKTIDDSIGDELFSIQNYPEFYFSAFNPNLEFEKWACKQVNLNAHLPKNMEELIIPQGEYAVFQYKGNPQKAPAFFMKVFNEVLPNASLKIDKRPHFEILGEKFNKNADSSEEEIWIPIK
ncbi:MAG: GyrI-like domain-containing protein [Sphingobacteriaceae bacterium]|nr:GyrI-like domain-containing protein [Sphingobacteriaceae bacterium]